MKSKSNPAATRKEPKSLGAAVQFPSCVLESFFHDSCSALVISAWQRAQT